MKNYRKLIIISTNDLDRRIVELFAVDQLANNGVDIEYWNVSALTYNEKLKLSTIDGVKMINFSDKRTFLKRVKEKRAVGDPLFVVYMNYCKATYFFYRTLSKYKCDILYCVNGEQPQVYDTKQKSNRIPNLFLKIFKSRKNLSYILESKFYSFLLKTPLLRAAKYELLTCEKAGINYKVNRETQIVRYNCTDFQFYRRASKFTFDKPYIVFIDQFLPLHPDAEIARVGKIDPQKYFRQINHLFALIEKKYNCDVIIAGHPVSEAYYSNNDMFENRHVYFGKTANLVKGSIGVVAHFSTAISLVVLDYKPLLLVSNNDICTQMENIHKVTIAISECLGCKFKMLEDTDDDISFGEVDIEKYNSYKYGYVTNKESENKDNAEILLDILRCKL